jgi:hypothetical protein
MMNRCIYLAVATACLVCVAPASAQVAVRPGSVDAPYVHVDWNAGHVHVCAPFVNLDTYFPCCCAPRPACQDGHANNENRPLPQPATDEQARRQLAASGSELFDSLRRFNTADGWRHFLAVAPGDSLSAEQLRQPSAETAGKLKVALEQFDAAASDPEYRMIASLPAFKQTHEMLARYVAQRGNLAGASAIAQIPAANSETVAAKPASATLGAESVVTRHWSPASKQPNVGLSAMARDIARPEELPAPPVPHAGTD